MSKQATEVAYLPIAPGIDLESGDKAKTWQEGLSLIAAQPGYQAMYWGRQIEHPDIVQLVIDWEDISSHEKFITSPTYATFSKALEPILGGTPNFYHAHLPSHSPFKAIEAPAVECVSLFFEKDYDTENYTNWSQFEKLLMDSAEGAHAVIGGWVAEEVKHEKLGEDGKEGPGRLHWGLIGWDSVEAHMKYRETDGFKKAIPPLRDGPVGIEMHHVKFTKF